MSLPTTFQAGVVPSPSGQFLAAFLIDSLYHNDAGAANVVCQLLGATVLLRRVDPSTFEPDYVILGDGTTALVALGGSTNAAQWLGHAASAWCPLVLSSEDEPPIATVASFWLGFEIRRAEIFAALAPYAGKKILICGHSYGGAAANICANRLARDVVPNSPIEVLTFGEPKSYAFGGGPNPPAIHNRIVTTPQVQGLGLQDRDPVTLMPPGQVELAGPGGLYVVIAKLLGQLSYKQEGPEWYLLPDGTLTGPHAYPWSNLIPFVEVAAALGNSVANGYLHLMDTSYLAKSLSRYLDSPTNLGPLVPISSGWVANPATLGDLLGPALTSSTLNRAWLQPGQVITDQNRVDFSTVFAAATVDLGEGSGGATLLGGGGMPALLINPNFKGTYHFENDNEGTSESYFYTGNPTNFGYNQMAAKLKALWPFRSALSMCTDNKQCTNPFAVVAVTIQNEQVFRDAVTVSSANWPSTSYISPAGPVQSGTENVVLWGLQTYNNDAANVVWKAQFLDGQGHEAQQYFHGVPLYSQAALATKDGPIPSQNQGQKFTAPDPSWVRALNNFCNALVAQELGFRFTWRIWEPAGIKTPDYPVGAPTVPGNSTPLNVFYNLPGYPPNCYTFTMPQTCLATTLTPFVQINSKGRYRVICRGMKALGPINGRWPAIGWTSTGPPAGVTTPFPAAGQFCLTVVRRAAVYVWDGQGDVCPEAWSAMVPLRAVPAAGSPNPPGVANIILGTKKTGRPFDLQRGRSAIRKT